MSSISTMSPDSQCVDGLGYKHVNSPGDSDEAGNMEACRRSRPLNPVGAYLSQVSETPLLRREDEKALFTIIESASERIRDIMVGYAFVSDMYIAELERLANGDQYFDSVVAENAGIRCAAYKKLIPEMCQKLRECADRLAGARMLVESLKEDDVHSAEAGELLRYAREEMSKACSRLAFRRTMIESFCDAAERRFYRPYQRQGDGMKEIAVYFGMPPEEFMSSFDEILAMRDVIQSARSQIVEANMRLVVHVAKKYVNRGIELSDLLQDGSVGLVNAVKKFDVSRGHKFSTFATWWIRQAISRSLTNNSRMIRVPAHIVDHLNKLNAKETALTNKLGRAPRVYELASAMGMSCGAIRQLMETRQQVVSLDSPMDGETDTTIGAVIKNESSEDPAEKSEQNMLRERVQKALECLNDRERMVISMRFGMEDGAPRTLEDIGRLFNVTREHIRQVEIEAFEKLRTSADAAALAELAKL